MKALVIAAHPDDEVLGCGGTIAQLAKEGHEVSVAILGEGITSRFSTREEADPALVENLKNSAREVARILQARHLHFYDLPDNRFDTLPLLQIIKIIEDLIERVKPSVVYTHHGGDLNVDHALVFRAVLTATRPTADCPVKEIYAFEVPSSTDWAFQQLETPFRANTFVDITQTIETKLRALEKYAGETRAFPHPRSPEALRATAQRWGSVVGVEGAEAFELIRSIKSIR